ncbi:TetR/AcrR family transcriptional regulator [Pseudonocardia humida]|uniref:TetR/AcrR family transcriptional regulator C-terminal domain-containing protein n=1 Tax=Pseudonocardia humida TaxID=2800819 RepID=A0ABT1A0Z2_9PSEU|nr:TetR/AcrR family transcriptional regulator C-terminal domain-containing protein [Pseudonocardia humida]MCO1656667.1 TetR/AcrR family transcriptional regulator C-terminal domain-containing protein [Pseudonocardia humida]
MAGSIWLRRERTGRGPVPEHSRAEITAVAVALADADGLAAVSMRKVAAAIGTGPASLYRYVDNRDELVELMADAVIGEIDLDRPPSDDWLADLVALAHAIRGVYRRHRWLLDVVPGRGLGPNTVDVMERALAAMSVLDVPAATKMETFALLNATVVLLVRTEAAVPDPTGEYARAHVEFLASVAAAGGHPHLAAALADPRPAPDPGEDLVDRVLPRVLAGLLDTTRRTR